MCIPTICIEYAVSKDSELGCLAFLLHLYIYFLKGVTVVMLAYVVSKSIYINIL